MTLVRDTVAGSGTGADPYRPATVTSYYQVLYNPTFTFCLVATDQHSGDLQRFTSQGLSVSIIPDTIPAGSQVRVLVAGATPGEDVRATLESGASLTRTSNAQGIIEAAPTVPANAPKGFHRIAFLGLTSGKTAEAYVTVT